MSALSQNARGLVITQGIRLIFGLYLVFTDWLAYDDPTSAVTVFIIYLLLGIFTVLFVKGKRFGLAGILTLSTLLIIANTIFTFVTTGGDVDAGLHSVENNVIPTILRYVFFAATLYFSIMVIRQKRNLEQ